MALSDTVLQRAEAEAVSASEVEANSTFPNSQANIERKPFSSDLNYFDWAANLIAEVAEGVHFAHLNQVLHRDIKPSNLLLSRSGTARVSDFGLARDLSEPGITQTGEIIGTPYYMAPEQISAGEVVDRPVDIYAMGATLYELLTLQPPFPGDSRDQVLARIANEEVIAPRKFNSRTPVDLETICLKALAKRPEDRYASAQELAADLRRFVRREPIAAKRSGLVDRGMKWIDRHRALAASIAALPMCVAIVATVFAVRNHRLANALKEETLRANSSVFDAKVDQARAILATSRPRRRSESLRSIASALAVLPQLKLAAEEDEKKKRQLRQQVVSALGVPELRESSTWKVERPWTSEVEFAPDFEIYAQPSRDGEVRILRAKDDGLVASLNPTDWPARQMRFSPDGRYLATKHYVRGPVDNAKVYVWDISRASAATTKLKPLLELSGRYIFLYDFDFARIRTEFASVNPNGKVEIYSLEDGRLLREIDRSFKGSAVLAYSKQDWLALAPYRGNLLEVWQASDNPKLVSSKETESKLSAIAWKPSRNELASGTVNGEVQVWDAGLEQDPRVLQPHKSEIITIHFQPKGTLLATRTLNEQVSISDTANLQSQPLSQNSDRLHVMGCGFSEDGRRLGFCKPREFGFYDVSDSVLTVLSSDKNSKQVHEIRFHPKYSALLVRTVRDGIEFWDTKNRRLIKKLEVERHLRFRFSSDGKELVASSSRHGISKWPITVDSHEELLTVQMGERQKIYDKPVQNAVLNSSGEYVACWAAEADNQTWLVSVLDSETGAVICSHQVSEKPRFFKFVTNSRLWVASEGGTQAQVLDVTVGEFVEKLPLSIPQRAWDYSAAKRLFIHSSENVIEIRDAESGNARTTISLADRRWHGVRFSPDGQFAITGNGRSSSLLLEVESGEVLTALESPTQEGAAFYTFSPDNSQVAVAGHRDIHIWDLTKLKKQLGEMDLCWDE